MTATGDLLLKSVLADPADDTARLVYADWCDENGDPDRAEFVRAQIDLLKCHPSCGIGKVCRAAFGFRGVVTCAGVRDRARELEAAHPEWRRLPCPGCRGKGRLVKRGAGGQSNTSLNPTCPTCGGTGDLFRDWSGPVGAFSPSEAAHTVTFARGSVDAVSCTLGEVGLEGECERCRGRGGEEKYPADDPTNRLLQGSHWYGCDHCDGTGRVFATTPWARAVVGAAPVARFTVTDREPYQSTMTGRWLWFEGNHDEHSLPRSAFDELDEHPIPHSNPPRAQKPFPTRQVARDALALALGRLVRRAVYPKPPPRL